MNVTSKQKGRRKVESLCLQAFCKTRRLDASTFSPGLRELITACHVPYMLFAESCGDPRIAGSDNPLDGLLITMSHRGHETANSALGLLAIGQLQGAEVVARTVFEHSAYMLYILQENTAERMLRYMASYVEKEREQNRKWKNSTDNLQSAQKTDHLARIADKDEVLEHYDRVLAILARQLGVDLSTASRQQPNLYQVFEKLGRTVEYRTVYAALCSQTHQDAEDLINRFIVDAFTNTADATDATRKEKHAFSILMVLCAARLHLETLAHVGHHYALGPVSTEAARALRSVLKQSEKVASCLASKTFPKAWIGLIVEGI